MDNEEKKECSYTPEGEDCPKHGKKCCKTEEKKRKKGMYGLEDEGDRDDATEDNGSMPQDNTNEETSYDVEKSMRGMSRQKKQRAMERFRERSAEAAKRKKDNDRKAELSRERRTKGIRFYDSKGSGYIKGGKKHYD